MRKHLHISSVNTPLLSSTATSAAHQLRQLLCLFSLGLLLLGCDSTPQESRVNGPSDSAVASKDDTVLPSALSLKGQRLLLSTVVEPPCTMNGLTGSSLSSLRLLFVGHDLEQKDHGKELSTELSLTPDPGGSWRWSGANELSFQPTSDWSAAEYTLQLRPGVLAERFALDRLEHRFSPRGSCVNLSSQRLSYRITAPKLPSRPTDTLPDQVIITFDQPLASPKMLAAPLPADVATITPTLSGAWNWASPTSLVFQPKDGWQPGTAYEVTFSPTVFADSAVVPGYRYRFSTPQSSVARARATARISGPAALTREEQPKPQPLTIEFGEPVAATHLINLPLTPEQAPSVSPPVEGEWRWSSDRLLQFTPRQHWPAGKSFSVTYSGVSFGDKQPGGTTTHEFSTMRVSGTVQSQELASDPLDPRLKRAAVALVFSHPVDKGSLEQKVVVLLREAATESEPAGKPRAYPFKVTYDDKNFTAYLVSDPIPVPERPAEVLVGVEAGVRSSVGSGETIESIGTVVQVPDAHTYFRINDVSVAAVPNDKRGTDQVLIISSSAGVAENLFADAVSVRLLPKGKPGINLSDSAKSESEPPYQWSALDELSSDVIAAAERVAVTPQPAAEHNTKQLSLKLQAEPGRSLLVEVSPELRSVEGFKLGRSFQQIVQVGDLPREIRFLSPGSLLSISGERKVSLLTRDVSNVEIEVARILPQAVNQLVTQTAGNFANPTFVSWNFGADDLSQRFTERRTFSKLAPGQANYSHVDLGALLSRGRDEGQGNPRGLFLVTATELPSEEQTRAALDTSTSQDESGDYDDYYGAVDTATPPRDQRLFLLTDIGLVVKRNRDDSRELFAVSFERRAPLASASVKVLGRNGLPVFSGTTGSDGRVSIPSLAGLVRENQPVVFTVEKQGDFSFLPFERDDRRLNVSRFDVGGVVSRSDGPGIQAFLFSDRGLYRPGDEINLGMIVRPDDWKQDLSGLPLELSVTDPRGQEIRREKIAFDKFGMESYQFTTLESSPVGRYEAGLYVLKDGSKRGSLLGSTTLRVEEFLPDRMVVEAKIQGGAAESAKAQTAWVRPDQLFVHTQARNLIGTPAENRRVTTQLTIMPATPEFPAFPGYLFSNPARSMERFEQPTADTVTSASGEATVAVDLSRFGNAVMRVQAIVQVYEPEGGRSVGAEASALVTNFGSLVGIHPKGDLRYIRRGSQRAVDIVAINAQLVPVVRSNLRLQQRAQRWVSVLTKQPNGLYGYQSVLKETVVSESALALEAKPQTVNLETTSTGDFVLAIVDETGSELNKVSYSVIGEGDTSPQLDGASQLELTLDRKEYLAGDTIELQVRAPYSGTGLITIEKDRVYTHKWFTTSGLNSVQRIEIPRELEGNGYVSVSIVRALDSKEIFLSPLSYAVQPFSLSKAPRANALTIEAPDVIKPGETINISFKASRPGRAFLFLVDEGILQVARYKTPDPLGYFFRKRALEVDTTQVLDLLLPEFSIERALSGAGGDEDMLARHQNPFKRKREAPVAVWLGTVDVGPSVGSLSYRVPDYFDGTVRVMGVVASDNVAGTATAGASTAGNSALGSSQSTTIVRGDFVIAPSVPPAIAPGDTAVIPISVTNNTSGANSTTQVSVTAELSAGLELVSQQPGLEPFELLPGREKTVLLEVRAKDVAAGSLGAQTIKISALGGSGLDRQSSATSSESPQSVAARSVVAHLGIRPLTPLTTRISAGASETGSIELPISRMDAYPDSYQLTLTASSLPIGFGRGLISYLESYPYGCTEQTVSRAVPALVLKRWPSLAERALDPKTGATAVARAVKVLSDRQNTDGSLSNWYPGGDVSAESSVYAALFLLEARERGFDISLRVFDELARFLRVIAARTPTSLDEARVNAMAIYVLTRHGVVTTSYLLALRSWLDQTKSDGWMRDSIAAFLGSSYALLQQKSEATKLLKGVPFISQVARCSECFHDRYTHSGWYLYLASRHYPEGLTGLSPTSVASLLGDLIGGAQHSYNAAVALLGLDSYMMQRTGSSGGTQSTDSSDAPTPIKAIAIGSDGGERALQAAVVQEKNRDTRPLALTFPLEAQMTKVRLSGPAPLFYFSSEQGYARGAPKVSVQSGIEVSRSLLDPASGTAATQVKLGESLEVVVRVRSLIDASIPNVALVDLLPGGFEIEMSPTRFTSDERGNPGERNWGFGLPGATFRADFAEAREDRVLLFGTVPHDQVAEYRYRLRATNRGTFMTPPVYAEGMYDRTLSGLAPGAPITVSP